MSAPRFSIPKALWVDPNGVPAVGYQLRFFVTGTDNPSPVYADALLANPLQQPVTALAGGWWPDIFLNPAITYKVKLYDTNGAQVWFADPVTASTVFYEARAQVLGGPLGANEVVWIWPFAVAVSFPANFAGSVGHAITAASATGVINITNQAATPIGSVAVAGSTFAFASAAGQAVSAAPGETWIGTGSNAPDATLALLSWAFIGVVG